MNKTSGFSLIELMVVVAIVGILAAIAIPSYMGYTKRAKYVEIMTATAPYKLAVEECFQINANLEHCNSGEQGIPLTRSYSQIAAIDVRAGLITVTPTSQNFSSADTYMLQAEIVQQQLIWDVAKDSGCLAHNLCRQRVNQHG